MLNNGNPQTAMNTKVEKPIKKLAKTGKLKIPMPPSMIAMTSHSISPPADQDKASEIYNFMLTNHNL